mgnify:CR=1 FL=1
MKKVFSVSAYLVREQLIGPGVEVHAVGSVVARDTHEVLLVRHPRYGLWLPPGGCVESNETPWEAVVREVGEETGLVLTEEHCVSFDKRSIAGLFRYDEHLAGDDLHMNFNFAARAPAGEAKISAEHVGFAWQAMTVFDAKDLPDNVRCNLRFLAEVWGDLL